MGISFNPLGSPTPPDPRKFTSTPTSPLPMMPTAYGNVPPGISQEQASQILNAVHSNPDLAGVWDTIQGIGGDVWGAISKLIPHDANGNIDWGAIGKDAASVASWVKNNASTIIDGLNAYNQYQRQGQSDKYAKEGLDLAKARYASQQPLRDAGQAGMLDPSSRMPDLTSLKSQAAGTGQLRAQPMPLATGNAGNAGAIAGPNSGNPFAKGIPMAPSGPSAPPMPTQPGSPQPSLPGGAGPIGNPSPLTPTDRTPSVGIGPRLPTSPAIPPAPSVGVNGPPPAMLGLSGSIGQPAQPLPLMFAPQSGPIKNGPQDRMTPTPQYPPLPYAGV